MIAVKQATGLYTVSDAAKMLGVTPGRVRQILLEHPMGVMYGTVRLFTREEMDALESIRKAPGRPRKKVS